MGSVRLPKGCRSSSSRPRRRVYSGDTAPVARGQPYHHLCRNLSRLESWAAGVAIALQTQRARPPFVRFITLEASNSALRYADKVDLIEALQGI